MNKVLVFTATYNEKANIEDLLNKILSLNLDLDIYVIDDNSPDKTNEILKFFSKKYKNIFFKVRPEKLGLDSAHKEAFKYAVNKGYEVLITMDADLSHDPNDITLFLNEIKKNDFVIGSRYMKGGKNNMKISRYLLSFFGNKLIKFLFNIKEIDEYTTSYRCIRVEKLKSININEIEAKGYSFFMNCIHYFHKNNFKISQVPIIFSDRKTGKSKIPKIEILRTLFNLVILKLRK